MERVETVIVGGGQCGLATSYYLTRYGREHVVLEQAARAGHSWRNRWDSFTLVTPNWTVKLPGAEFDGPRRDDFMPRDDIVAYFERYAELIKAPVRYNTRVTSIQSLDGNGYRVRTDDGDFAARNVVIATGFERIPRIPPYAANLSPDFEQLHSGRYRNPDSLPSGAVLVVGSAQSGCQIAEELHESGRRVFLSVGGAGRAPRRYRGRDIVDWLDRTGFFNMTSDKMPVPREHFAPPHLSGKNGGHSLNLHKFAQDGVTLLGHLRGIEDCRASIAPDLHQGLAKADGFEAEILKMVEGYIRANGIDAPADELPALRDGFDQQVIEELDLRDAGITTVIWATGYKPDFGFIEMPVADTQGYPIQTDGVSPHRGLYFMGVPFMPSMKTGFLIGVGESSEHIASNINASGMAKAAA